MSLARPNRWSRGRRPLAAATAAILTLTLLVAGGCRGRIGGSTPPDRVIDELRAERTQLQHEVERLQEQITLRLAEIEALRGEDGGPPATLRDVEPPRFQSIQFARYSGFIDTTRDGGDDTLRLYVITRDQHQRFLPVAGEARLTVVAIPDDSEPTLILRQELTAAQWDAAYRSGIGGTHYTVEVPLPTPTPDVLRNVRQVTVKLSLTDAATGATLSREQTMPLSVR